MQALHRTSVKQVVAFLALGAIVAIGPGTGFMPLPAFAQGPPMFRMDQLEGMCQRIALYPDPLLTQVLAASTFPNDIPPAAGWANEHGYLKGDQLAQAISSDRLPWDPSVQSLLPFPNVLNMMAGDMRWTSDLGNAFLSQRDMVMDAIQNLRHRSMQYGYLRTGPQIVVNGGPYITIMPANPGYVVVPAYNPMVVYAAPRPGFFAGGAISFGFGFAFGAAFRPWGWYGGYNHFGWNTHTVVINNYNWNRNYVNRGNYVHPYEGVRRYEPARRVESHEHDRGYREDRHDDRHDDRHGHGR